MRNQRRNLLESRAEKLLESLGTTEIPVPIDRVARALGVRLRFSPLDEELSGMIFIKSGVPIVGVNSLHHRNRQRFTIAHEVAHLYLHRQHISSAVHVDKQFAEPVLKRDTRAATGTDPIEVEANQFAAALLLPRFALSKELATTPIDIDDDSPLEELSKKFGVSKATLQYRIRNL